ncbi:MAG: transposase [Planctomycetes bacterium]|jgi:REP element-mobilizing transposase RayT|nr:transposase [Planctomycetota bacterium]
MARPLRIEYAGALYHVMSRGNEQRPIVRDDVDRRRRLDWLRRTVETYGWRLHAFVLMDNHEHLFVETPEPNLSAGMQYLNGSYTSYFNRRMGRVGHLFQGRFKAHLVDEQGYFQAVSRYIHLNPVRASLVRCPGEYPWSSYPGYVRAAQAVPWATYERVLQDFGPGDEAARRRRYGQYVEAVAEEPHVSPFATAVEGLIVGSEDFVRRIKDLLGNRTRDKGMPILERLRPRPSLEAVAAVAKRCFEAGAERWSVGRRSKSGGRAAAAYLCRCRYGYRCTEIAAALGFASVSSVSRSVRDVEAQKTRYRRALRELERQLDREEGNLTH